MNNLMFNHLAQSAAVTKKCFGLFCNVNILDILMKLSISSIVKCLILYVSTFVSLCLSMLSSINYALKFVPMVKFSFLDQLNAGIAIVQSFRNKNKLFFKRLMFSKSRKVMLVIYF